MRGVSFALLLFGCGAAASPPKPAHHDTPPIALRSPRDVTPSDTAPKSEPAAAPVPAEPSLPADVRPGVPVLLPVDGDHALRVVHGVAATREAIVYLHGVCGDPDAFRSWAEVASHHATLIGLLADTRCKGTTRYRWEATTSAVHARIERALELVAQARNGLLDTSHVTLMGYSQGALRVEALVKHYPETYERVVLGSPPIEPDERALASAEVVAIVGGEREAREHMLKGVDVLAAHGLRAKFFLLPRATHGQYGPEGPRVMDEALGFVFADGN